ncbi:NAD(P)/FAD-dependent oxidoreductase [Nocardia brasiliensis]|uniref:FAD-dependent pyridine nucleotide-disulfide oxidoreductase n=1 Tax=Nocardia brasiliensis (strain ATCC 700358 / HUJEG-1) TaxID=1133849 RepID=K0EQI5_NOCB7|nr:FAD-dependent oxidoreductase [Nocardia brasiliensis]AFT99756.1 FAD-dependent pyridine nucleotide-disulfide oxidoreductase [Nocardia brasiliensis ATCC 700358]OCF87495.1 oxidoreductase [Nocardia brasiliensis]
MKHRIVVLGAGYAGANTAGRLAKRLHGDDVEITLVNADTEFVERIRLHQLASGQDLPSRPLRAVFAGTGVQVRTAWVTAVDVDRKTVDLVGEHGDDTLGYDTLVYALGSTTTDHGVPGVADHAYDIAGKQAASRLRTRLAELAPGASVLIVGGGLTGIEAATEIAEAYPELAVAIAARGGVGDWLSAKAQRHLDRVFDRLGITVHENADVARVEANAVITAAGELPAEVTVWTAGFTVHPIAAATTLEVSETGRIVVDAGMRSVSHPDVYAVGDAAIAAGVGGKPLRMACATATPMAWLAADVLAARLTGRKVPETTIGYALQCVSLGRRDAIVQRVTPADEVTSTVLTGRIGARIKELICASTAWSISHPTMMMPTRRRHIVAGGVETPVRAV